MHASAHLDVGKFTGVLYINSKGHEVRGAIWGDERGAGLIKMYKGHKVQVVTPALRQCTGYFENWDLDVSAPRTSFVENKEWFDCIRNIRKITEQYPPIGHEIDEEKEFKHDRELAKQVLDLPKAPTAFGADDDLTKDDNSGDRADSEITGYPISKELPDPNRKIKRRKKHKRNNANQAKIGSEGGDTVKKTSQKTESTRKNYIDFEETKAHHGPERPLMHLFKDRTPWMLVINMDNDEYLVRQKMRRADPRIYRHVYFIWLGEAEAECDGFVDDRYRMLMSRERVTYWKKAGYYPKIIVTLPPLLLEMNNN